MQSSYISTFSYFLTGGLPKTSLDNRVSLTESAHREILVTEVPTVDKSIITKK